MTRPRRLAAAAAAAAVLASTACSVQRTAAASAPSQPTALASPGRAASPAPLPPGPGGSLPVALPRPSSIDNQDATAVSAAAVTIQWTMDTATDTSQYQAELRSAPFLTPAYLAALRATPPVAAPGAQWNEWAVHRAYTTVTLLAEPDGLPPDTATLARRQWGITATPHSPCDSASPQREWTAAPLTATVFVILTRPRAGAAWRVAGITVTF